MTTSEIKSLALKLGAIYLVIQFLLVVSFSALSYAYALTQWFGSTLTTMFATFIGAISISLPIIVARILWKQSNELMKVDINNLKPEQITDESPNFIMIQSSIICGVGILLIGISTPEVINSCAYLVKESSIQSNGLKGTITSTTIFYFIGSVAQLIFGISLVMGRNGWSTLVYKIRYAGTIK